MKVFLAVSVLVLACTVIAMGTPQTEEKFLEEVLNEMKSKKTAELKTQDYDYDNIGEKITAELNIQQDDDYDGGDDDGGDTDGLVEAMASNFSFGGDNKNVLMAMLMTESLEEPPVKSQIARYVLRLAKRYIRRHLRRFLRSRFGRYLRRVICTSNGK